MVGGGRHAYAAKSIYSLGEFGCVHVESRVLNDGITWQIPGLFPCRGLTTFQNRKFAQRVGNNWICVTWNSRLYVHDDAYIPFQTADDLCLSTVCTTQMAQFSTFNTLFPHNKMVYSFSHVMLFLVLSPQGIP